MKHNFKHNEKKSNGLKTAFVVVAILIVAALIVSAFTSLSKKQAALGGVTADNTEDTQIVNVQVQGSNYILTPPTFTMGKQTTLVFDMNTLQGCSRSVVLPEFGVRKYLSESDNTITFTPLKAGTFRIQCSMNMYRGSFTVTSDGTTQTQAVAQNQNVQTETNTASLSGPSCGMAGKTGGCGCGMMR